jgi:hypothetical protein
VADAQRLWNRAAHDPFLVFDGSLSLWNCTGFQGTSYWVAPGFVRASYSLGYIKPVAKAKQACDRIWRREWSRADDWKLGGIETLSRASGSSNVALAVDSKGELNGALLSVAHGLAF